MVKMIKNIMIVLLLIAATFMTTYAFSAKQWNEQGQSNSIIDNYPYISEMLLRSNRYTQQTNVTQAQIDAYEANYYPILTHEEILAIGFEQVLDNDQFILYFDAQYFAIMIRNIETGYLYSSRPYYQSQADGNIPAWRRANSGIIFDYVSADTISTGVVTEGSVLGFANARPTVDNDVPLAMNYNIMQSSYSSEQMEIDWSVDQQASTLNAILKFNTVLVGSGAAAKPFDIGFEFNVSIKLTEVGIDASIDKSSIVEKNPNYRLLNISLFPYLGAAKQDYVPGYFVIPDGVGALVRLNRAHNTTFIANYYGNDSGYNTQFIPELTLPVYGVIHLEGENGFYAHVNQGAEHTRLYAQYWGNSSKYHTIYNKFHVRNMYRTVIDRAGNGEYATLAGLLKGNYDVSYEFLSNDDASYVGMAHAYQNYLVGQEILTPKEVGSQIPIQTGYIMSDRENAFIGTTKVEMTTTDDIKSIYQYLKEEGMTKQTISLYGWSEDGYVNRAPYRDNTIESYDQFKSLSNMVQQDQNDIYLENDYFQSSDLSPRVNYNFHVTYAISKVRNVYSFRDFTDQVYTMYYLNPAVSEDFAKADKNFYSNIGNYGLQLTAGGLNPYSYYENGNYYDRSDFISHVTTIADQFSNFATNQPSLYLYEYVDHYFDMEIAHSGFNYYTDLVPFVPIVLKGYIPFYTSYLNFNALGIDRLLNLVDFGMNPSYLLTAEPTYKMKYTSSSRFYTTEFDQFKAQMIEEYHFVNDALKHVIGESIINREVVALGIVKVTYSNNVVIYINYSNSTYTNGSVSVNAQDYEVIL